MLRPLAIMTSALVLALMLTACARSEERLLVFAAVSMRDALDPIGKEFEDRRGVKVDFNFSGSTALAGQIDRGAHADILIAAGVGPVRMLEEKGLVEPGSIKPVAFNRLVLASGQDMRISSIIESLRDSQRVAVADPKLAPAGGYAREALESLGLWEELQPRLVFGHDVRTTLAYAESGDADLAIVYLTDALARGNVRVLAQFDEDTHSPIVYPGAVIKESDNKALAGEFLDFMQESFAQEELKKAGFSFPDGS